jgi:fermentation-respiration switch protein FrsA (DUF1100 family)
MLVRIALLVVVIYAALVLMVYLFQSRLVFLPDIAGRELVATPNQVGLAYDEVRLTTADGETLHGWWLPQPQARTTVLFFHGNAGNISHRFDTLEIFRRLGVNVLIFDYRGYGQSTGRPTERGLYRDARSAWDWVVEQRGIAPEDIVLFGRSMGGAVAAWLATQVPAGGLIVESSFSSVPDLGADHYRWLPVRWLARIRFPTANYVAEADLPLLVIHSRDDEIIPFDHGERIAEAAGEPESLVAISGDHNTGFLTTGDAYVEALKQFLEGATSD